MASRDDMANAAAEFQKEERADPFHTSVPPVAGLPAPAHSAPFGIAVDDGPDGFAHPDGRPANDADGVLQAAARLGRLVWDRALDIALPPQCLGCRTETDKPGRLCSDCWGGLTFLGAPLCRTCGIPFDHADLPDPQCGACARKTPAFDRARAAIAYDDGARDLILRFKHGDRLETAGILAGFMTRAGADLLADADLLVPVPLHRLRLLKRRYNQAALLAARLGAAGGIAVGPCVLSRVKRTPSQGGLNQAQRRRNVRGAFAVRPGAVDRVAGARIVLIDDVFTTGATAEACARTLKKAGARRVDLLCLARVVKPR